MLKLGSPVAFALFVALLYSACTGPEDLPPADDDAGPLEVDAGVEECPGGEPGDVDLGEGCPLPEGRVKCFFGLNNNCTSEGEECCEARDICYFPATEADLCR